MAQAMLRLLAKPKITAVFCVSLILKSPVFGRQFPVLHSRLLVLALRIETDTLPWCCTVFLTHHSPLATHPSLLKCGETLSQSLLRSSAAPRAVREDSSWDNPFLPAHPAATPF